MTSLQGIRLGRELFVIGAMALACAAPALADDQYVGVARVSVLNGTAVIQHANSGDKIGAIVNAPVTVGDYLSTGAGSRAEIQLDDTNFIRASAQTQMRFTQLDPSDHTVQLAAGTIELGVLRYPDAHPQVQTPSITIRPIDSGRYRVTVTDTGDTLVTVRSGRADLVTPQGAQTIGAGTTVLVAGPASDPRIQDIATIAYDDFDAWSTQRDSFMASALAATGTVASAYANSGIAGMSDLNAYGSWGYAPSYGSVWIPYGQIAGWSPYRSGRWAWQPYFGWTWVGYEPWGWAPYHYGRWFYRPGFGWAWCPGARISPYYWQPGLVAFFGYGYGGGLSMGFNFSFGNVGWVPLAPNEPYYPWRRGYVGRSIIGYNNPNFSKIYRNVSAPGGIKAIRGGDLNGGAQYQYLQVRGGDLQKVGVAQGGLPVSPSNAAYRFTNGAGEVAHSAPLSPRFSTFSQPALPSIARSQGSTTQMVRPVVGANRAATAAGADRAALDRAATGHTATDSTRLSKGSDDAWNRFGSNGVQTATSVHTLNGTQTSARSTGETKAAASSQSQMHQNTGSDVWSRFESTGGLGSTAGGSRATTAASGRTDTTVQRYGEPGSYKMPASPGLYTPNSFSSGRNTQWMTPRSYAPAPAGAGMYVGGNAGPAQGGNSMPHGGGSGHARGH
jgi:hypothetical protein